MRKKHSQAHSIETTLQAEVKTDLRAHLDSVWDGGGSNGTVNFFSIFCFLFTLGNIVSIARLLRDHTTDRKHVPATRGV